MTTVHVSDVTYRAVLFMDGDQWISRRCYTDNQAVHPSVRHALDALCKAGTPFALSVAAPFEPVLSASIVKALDATRTGY